MRELRLYLDAGLSALPADRAGKRPSVASWREYQKRLPTAAEADAWAASRPGAVCVGKLDLSNSRPLQYPAETAGFAD